MSFQKWLFSLVLFVTLSVYAQDTRKGDNFALVVIDMQSYFVERGGNANEPGNVKKVNEILENQARVIEMAKKQKIPIIFIEYESYGPTNEKLTKAAQGGDVFTITKNADGMLDSWNNKKDQLSAYLRKKEIGNLIITGANGGACVWSSIEGSLDNNYNVLAYSKGIADFNYEDFIYPYDNLYTFKPSCESCSFREIDDQETIELELATQQKAKSEKHINDSDRGITKDVPVKKKVKTKPTKQSTSATVQ